MDRGTIIPPPAAYPFFLLSADSPHQPFGNNLALMEPALAHASFGEQMHVLMQAAVAMLFGGVIGWERETAGKWAGFRTHILVCVGATLFVRVAQFLVLDSAEIMPPGTVRPDPVRAIEAIVTGISFLGAGTIIREPQQGKARGLTTAASLFVVGPIGIAVALERYWLAAGTTLLAVIVLHVLGRLERFAGSSPTNRSAESGKETIEPPPF